MDSVVLFFPKITFGEENSFLLPLSLLFVATPLRAAGYDVSIIDARTRVDWREELRRQVESKGPVCVGISSLTGPQLLGAMEAAQIVRDVSSEIPVVWGGVHASLMPSETIREELVDAIVVGEGEETFVELVDALKHRRSLEGVRGLYYKEDGQPKQTPPRDNIDLNTVPPLAYDLLDLPKYFRPFWDKVATGPTFITSRGCPYACGYCYIEVFDKRRWRPMRPDIVLRNLKHTLESTGTKSVFCLDDMFFTDIRRVKEICREIIDSGVEVELDNVNCRADAVCRFDDEVIELLVAAGVRRLFVGLESGSDRILKLIQKGSVREHSIRANRILKGHPIKPIYAFMAGFPHETVEDAKQTLSLMEQLLDENPDALITETSFFSPFPGTTLYGECKKMGVNLPTSIEQWARMNYNVLVEELFAPREIDFFYRMKMMSAYLDHKNYDKHAERQAWKNTAAKWISKDIRWRIRNEVYSPFPEQRLIESARAS